MQNMASRFQAVKNIINVLLMVLMGLACAGCSMFGYKSYYLSTELINDANKILTVEGRTNLPSGSPITSIIADDSEHTLARSEGLAENGAYCLVLDLSMVPGNKNVILEVYCDPVSASDKVKSILGDDGRYMMGSQIEETPAGNRLMQRTHLVLPMSRRDSAIKSVQLGDYSLGVSGLEGIIDQNPDDKEAQGWLALALLQHNPSERQVDSRAYGILKKINPATLQNPLKNSCQVWFDKINAEAAEAKEKRSRAEAIRLAKRQREQMKQTIKPGVSLGGVKIGATFKEAVAACPPSLYPSWNADVVKYTMQDRGVTVYFDKETKRVDALSTRKPKTGLKGGINIGSSLNDALPYYPGGRSRIIEHKKVADGKISVGEFIHPSGLILTFRREYGLFGPVNDEIIEMTVVAPFSWEDFDAKEEAIASGGTAEPSGIGASAEVDASGAEAASSAEDASASEVPEPQGTDEQKQGDNTVAPASSSSDGFFKQQNSILGQ
ncbi:MAG: hypothetical protein K6G50_12280 [bacterium]|nr:hypothetical protein [bacterium]